MATIHLICGFLGAGKSTFSKKLAKEVKGIHLNPDEWCMKLYSQEEYEADWDKCFDKTVEFLWLETKEYLVNDRDVVFDMGFWSKESRDYAKLKALEFGAESVLYYIYAPEWVLKERISARKEAIAEKNLDNFDCLMHSFEEPKEDENFVLVNNF